jgi:Glycosyl hydrolase catalytic core
VFLWIACCVAGVLALASGEARAAPLRPDLAITSVTTNRVSLVGRPFYVSATVIERSRRVGARARITVTANDIALATKNIVVRPGRRLVVKLPVALAAPGKTRLVTAVTGTKPVEAVISNNVRRATVDVAEFRARWSSVVVPSFGGYGGQFNHHVYSALSRAVGINDTNVVDMEQKMRALHPQFSRIFFTPQAFTDPDKMQSFVRTVLFAQSTGTTINITWQGGTLSVASGTVQKFANVLLDLVRNRGVTNLRWLTLQNEPNRTRMTMQQYETQYRELDAYIQSIRGQVRYMGGDLVRAPDGGAPNQAAWFQYMASRMSDILDAYSIHVFWDYWDTQKLVDRLKEVRAIVNTLPQQARKPIYVTEYGVRGLRVFNGAPQVDPGVWQDGSAIGQTNVSAFQQAWFDVLAANLGYVATSKWDSYFGRYDNGTQAYYFIGDPQNGWPLYPLYNLVQLLTTTVKREWKVAAVDSVPATSRLLGAYLGKNGQQTMVGLDTAGAQLNTASPTPISYSIVGLPPLKTLQLVVWNEAGNGLVGPARSVSTDAAGVASITVPQQGVFVLTTLRLPSS